MTEKNFGHLGANFQLSLIKTMIEDKKFSATIIEVMDSKYFDGPYFRYIVQNIKELYDTFGWIPDYETLRQEVMKANEKDTAFAVHIDTLNSIEQHVIKGVEYVQATAMNFCKQQVLKRELKLVEKIIENGDFEEYNKIETLIQNALQVGSHVNDVRDAFFDVKSVLSKDSRVPIPLGIPGLDNLLKGGLALGEFGVILAPTGVGKTTFLTVAANSAYNVGKNVLQIFFEDNENDILKKHYAIWSGISPNDQIDRADEVEEVVKEMELNSKGGLKMLKYPSGTMTVSDIKSKIRKLKTEGFDIDMLIIDYVDCLVGEKTNFGEEWKGEGSIMRGLESMTSEFNIAIWVATQGNRESISSEVVTTDQMGGSIKKAQIGHVVISVGKTLEQKEHKLGTMTLLKSRIGPDGIVFQNCKFDNEFLEIDTETQSTLLGYGEDKAKAKADRIQEVRRLSEERKERERLEKLAKHGKLAPSDTFENIVHDTPPPVVPDPDRKITPIIPDPEPVITEPVENKSVSPSQQELAIKRIRELKIVPPNPPPKLVKVDPIEEQLMKNKSSSPPDRLAKIRERDRLQKELINNNK